MAVATSTVDFTTYSSVVGLKDVVEEEEVEALIVVEAAAAAAISNNFLRFFAFFLRRLLLAALLSLFSPIGGGFSGDGGVRDFGDGVEDLFVVASCFGGGDNGSGDVFEVELDFVFPFFTARFGEEFLGEDRSGDEDFFGSGGGEEFACSDLASSFVVF